MRIGTDVLVCVNLQRWSLSPVRKAQVPMALVFVSEESVKTVLDVVEYGSFLSYSRPSLQRQVE